MIFCKNCGRYYSEGTAECKACRTNLSSFGHSTLQGTLIPETQQYAPVSSQPSTVSASTSSDVHSVFNRDKFLLRQKAFAIKEKYYVTDDTGSPIMFVERPAMIARQLLMLLAVAGTFFGGIFVAGLLSGVVQGFVGAPFGAVSFVVGFVAVLALSVLVFVLLVPKRHITFYKDDTKTEKVLEVKQLNKIEFPYANFSILDCAGNIIGSLRKNVLFDYVRRRWQVNNASGEQLCMAKEDSIILSLLRRTGIPIFLLLRTNFIFLRGKEVIGEFNRKLTLLDRYVLDLTADTQRVFDRRIALALGVMLDTGERR